MAAFPFFGGPDPADVLEDRPIGRFGAVRISSPHMYNLSKTGTPTPEDVRYVDCLLSEGRPVPDILLGLVACDPSGRKTAEK